MTYMTRLFLIFILLGSCASLPISYRDLPKDIYRLAFGYPNFVVTQSTFNSYPYSFAKVGFGKGQSVIMILESTDDNLFTWVGQDGVKLITKNGRVIKSMGLPHDVDIKPSIHRDNFASGEYFEVVNFSHPILLNADLFSSIEFKELSSLIYLEKEISVNVFTESIAIENIGWSNKNVYYLDSKSRVIKATQSLHPFLDQLHIEFYLK